ncbi:uncharacterized protein LOC132268550 [Cornus florida]|uniref:uncharacterized protein LOC132268550 n=1 Tax=Cornus florida TaxID=4283 RepID=UPI00289A7DBB|nr:uncharacterized protein LOC132268550 [Cornus florida]
METRDSTITASPLRCKTCLFSLSRLLAKETQQLPHFHCMLCSSPPCCPSSFLSLHKLLSIYQQSNPKSQELSKKQHLSWLLKHDISTSFLLNSSQTEILSKYVRQTQIYIIPRLVPQLLSPEQCQKQSHRLSINILWSVIQFRQKRR